jgi:hypothetical protein
MPTDARDDLGGDAGWVEHYCSSGDDIAEAVLADNDDQRRGSTDDGLGAQPSTLALNLALEADQGRQAECDQQLDDLADALTETVEERGVGEPHLHGHTLPANRANQREGNAGSADCLGGTVDRVRVWLSG